ncbi:phage major capsid protein [Kurthia massiliensis]|uniref:phage major capsid protein n=1 Tax=Kurthia massiliensis TaxID=1033739 RepID=UPI0002884DA9|nr:phage major capsid protein [Kurthia massiliensis]
MENEEKQTPDKVEEETPSTESVQNKITGIINKAESQSREMKFKDTNKTFIERFAVGVFKDAIERAAKNNEPIRLLYNHNPSKEVASTEDESLKLSSDENGVTSFEALLKDDEASRAIYQMVKSAVTDKMSPGFIVLDDEWTKENGKNVRTIKKIKFVEASIVDQPAYEDTEVVAEERSIIQIEGLEIRSSFTNQTNVVEPQNKKEEVTKTMDITQVTEINQVETRSLGERIDEAIETRALSKSVAGVQIDSVVAKDIVVVKEDLAGLVDNVEIIHSTSGNANIVREESFPEAQTLEEMVVGTFADPTFTDITVSAKEIVNNVSIGKARLTDNAAKANLGSYLADRSQLKVRKELEKQIFTGNDTGAGFKGILNDPDVKAFEVTEVLSSETTGDIILDMILDLDTEAQENAVVLVNRFALNNLCKIRLANGQYLLQGAEVNGKFQRTIHGVPIRLTAVLPNDHPIVVGDPKAYALLLREDAEQTLVDKDTASMEKRQATLYTTLYAGGAVQRPSGFKYVKVTTAA